MIHYLHIWWRYPKNGQWVRLVLDRRNVHKGILKVYKIKGTLWAGGRMVW